jgi:hypothetical protein
VTHDCSVNLSWTNCRLWTVCLFMSNVKWWPTEYPAFMYNHCMNTDIYLTVIEWFFYFFTSQKCQQNTYNKRYVLNFSFWTTNRISQMGKCILFHISLSKAFNMTLMSVCKYCTKGTSHRKKQNATHGHNVYTLAQISSSCESLALRSRVARHSAEVPRVVSWAALNWDVLAPSGEECCPYSANTMRDT